MSGQSSQSTDFNDETKDILSILYSLKNGNTNFAILLLNSDLKLQHEQIMLNESFINLWTRGMTISLLES